MGLWVGKKFTFLGLDYYWGTQIGGQKGKGPKMPKTPAQAVVLVIGLLISLALSCWLRPVVEWVQERQMLRLAERQIKNDLHRANAEGRTITGFQLCNGVPIPEYKD